MKRKQACVRCAHNNNNNNTHQSAMVWHTYIKKTRSKGKVVVCTRRGVCVCVCWCAAGSPSQARRKKEKMQTLVQQKAQGENFACLSACLSFVCLKYCAHWGRERKKKKVKLRKIRSGVKDPAAGGKRPSGNVLWVSPLCPPESTSDAYTHDPLQETHS